MVSDSRDAENVFCATLAISHFLLKLTIPSSLSVCMRENAEMQVLRFDIARRVWLDGNGSVCCSGKYAVGIPLELIS